MARASASWTPISFLRCRAGSIRPSAKALLLEGFVLQIVGRRAGDCREELIAEPAACCARWRGERPVDHRRALDVRDQFPAIAGWHYLDSAASAQKPQAVIDAITRGLCAGLCDGPSRRLPALADMTTAYEAARAAAAQLIGGAAEEVDVHARRDRGDQSGGAGFAQGRPQPRPASALEHHSNIVPWQLAGSRSTLCR